MRTSSNSPGLEGFVPLIDLADLEDGDMEPAELEGRPILLARVADSVFAFDETCTHQRCSLFDGDLEDDLVACPCHGAEFDLATGDVLLGPATEPLPVHHVRIDDGRVLVRLAARAPAELT
jgi:nitrite reductase/ring-hydroxylating ferredoxin subunit